MHRSEKPRSDKLLNVGCGRCYHDAWTNIDLVAAGPGVRQYDLRRGLPYPDDTFDGVYHSHVLEHLAPGDARSMLTECRRVLRPGGVLRVVVPDLEGIARVYLQTLDKAAEHLGCDNDNDDESLLRDRANHDWMTLELIDQMTRQRSGGNMGLVLSDDSGVNRDFIRSRMGHQMTGNDNRASETAKPRKTIGQRVSRALAGLRKQIALLAVTLIDGSDARAAYREGKFRQSGEIHRWMYDRVSLSRLLEELGFENPVVCSAQQSSIEALDDYQLDREGQQVRKPDSLYMEARKPITQTMTARNHSTQVRSSATALPVSEDSSDESKAA